YGGDEPSPASGIVGMRQLFDLVASFNFTDALSVALNVDTAKQDDAIALGKSAQWQGVAGYVNYKLNDRWRTAVRLEDFDDKDGFRTGLVQKWKEATVTLAYTPSKNVELRADLRGDKSDKNAFMQTSGSPKDSQQSVGLEALYKF
ncbi:MAG TPA: outer membrane beta-barrel protein, partial [Acidiferrobacterales bacterium]|nr:outer membrane beta-barrel protein [Acidiferrobacterales bacterium]